jgi:hypothetical protein
LIAGEAASGNPLPGKRKREKKREKESDTE